MAVLSEERDCHWQHWYGIKIV